MFLRGGLFGAMPRGWKSSSSDSEDSNWSRLLPRFKNFLVFGFFTFEITFSKSCWCSITSDFLWFFVIFVILATKYVPTWVNSEKQNTIRTELDSENWLDISLTSSDKYEQVKCIKKRIKLVKICLTLRGTPRFRFFTFFYIF